MKIEIEIDCGNAAFDDEGGGAGYELARILHKAADRLEAEGPEGCNFGLMDVNGNNVGRVVAHDD